ncbi:MAG: hypothetical protein O8C58_06850 [Candidatus Methanoperedens sp.]|nr:hypothetical protein [Candidatus Methanoperedens sp.]
MKGTIGIFLSLIFILIIGFFAVGFTSSVAAPTDATALAQYNNLSKATGIAAAGMNATTLIITAALLFSGIAFMLHMMRKK